MEKESLGDTLNELLAFLQASRKRRTLPDGRQIESVMTRRLTPEEIDRVFVLDQIAGLQAEKCGRRLPALPASFHPVASYLSHTHLCYLDGPGMRLYPTDAWLAEVRAIIAVPSSVLREPPQEDWMPAQKAVERANREGVAITLPTVWKWRHRKNPGLKTRGKTLPGRHHWEVEYHSLVLLCHRSAVESGDAEPCEGSFDAKIQRARAARTRRPG